MFSCLSFCLRQWYLSILIEKLFPSSKHIYIHVSAQPKILVLWRATMMIVNLFFCSHKFCASLNQLSILFKCFHFDFLFESGSWSCVCVCVVALGNRHVSHQLCFMLCFFFLLSLLLVLCACTFKSFYCLVIIGNKNSEPRPPWTTWTSFYPFYMSLSLISLYSLEIVKLFFGCKCMSFVFNLCLKFITLNQKTSDKTKQSNEKKKKQTIIPKW